MHGPDPNNPSPMAGFPQVGFLKNFISRDNISVGDYTYYDDPEGVERFEDNVLYHFPFVGDQLIIGKFCAIAKDVQFIMNGANHKLSGFSTYPFQIFGNGWERIMPGIRIGHGAIIGTKSVSPMMFPIITLLVAIQPHSSNLASIKKPSQCYSISHGGIGQWRKSPPTLSILSALI